MKKITIHKALAELKLLDSKIEHIVQTMYPIATYQKSRKKINGASLEEFEKSAKSDMDKLTQLVKNKSAIKAAIMESNSKTKVKIGEVEMTVAQAISEKDAIHVKKTIVSRLERHLASSIKSLDTQNELVEKELQEILQKNASKESVKATPEDIENISKPFRELKEWVLCDPLDLKNLLDKMRDEVAEFETNVDIVLSESNAVTYIEIAE